MMNIEDRNIELALKYKKLTDGEVSSDDAIDRIAIDYKIGKFYVRSILRSLGIRIGRKGKDDMKANLSDRDRQIIKLAEQGETTDIISEFFDVTPTRIRQVIRDNVKNMKHVRIERVLSGIKNDVHNNVEYHAIIDKYGEKAIREVKANLGYNLFKACQARRDADIVSMGKQGYSAKDIGEKHGLVADYIYSIWHANGIHKDPKQDLTPEARTERNKKIYDECQTKKIGDVAKEYGLSYTMVKIIVKSEQAKHDGK